MNNRERQREDERAVGGFDEEHAYDCCCAECLGVDDEEDGKESPTLSELPHVSEGSR